jgi:NAD(P)-dependent dehydrogenase (short-subunit alcohol dehydrogenase family)
MKNPLFDLTGRVALETGAASGIGRQTAQVLAQMGATVIATDRDETAVRAAAEGLPNGALALRHDVTSVVGCAGSWTCSSTTPASC